MPEARKRCLSVNPSVNYLRRARPPDAIEIQICSTVCDRKILCGSPRMRSCYGLAPRRAEQAISVMDLQLKAVT